MAMNRNESSILLITAVGHVLCHWCMLVFAGILEPLRLEFGLSRFWITNLPFIGFVLMGVGAVPAGLLADRFGPRRILTVYFAATFLACSAAALAKGPLTLTLSLTLLGASVSLYHPSGLSMISQGIRSRGKALGIHGMAGCIGLVGSSIGLWAVAMGSWRFAYWTLAIIAAVGCAATRIVTAKPIAEYHTQKSTSANVQSPVVQTGIPAILILLYVAMMLGGFNYRTLTTALPTYLMSGSAGSYKQAGSLIFFVFASGGIGQLLVGRLADRKSPLTLYVSLVATTVPLALMLALTGGGGRIAVPCAMALAFVSLGVQPVENLLIAQYTAAKRRSLSYGLKFLLTFGVGALGAPAVGAIWEHFDLRWAFVLIAAIAIICTLLVWRLVQRVRAEHDVQPRLG